MIDKREPTASKPTSQHNTVLDRYGGSNLGLAFGLVALALLGVILFFSSGGGLLNERPLAVPS